MKTAQNIIRAFIEDNEPKTIREIAQRIKADYKITHTAVQLLIKKKIVLCRRVGKSSWCSLNSLYYGSELYLAEEERKEELLKNRNIEQVYNEILAKINTCFFIMLLFGSYAKRHQTKTSDIDLMFITNNKSFEERIQTIISIVPLKIHALVFTEEEFKRMKDAKESTVVKEALKRNIILYGTETYYQLKNA